MESYGVIRPNNSNCNTKMGQCINDTHSDCILSPIFWTIYHNTYTTAYYIIMPIFFIFGLIGHSFCLIAFIKAARKESAYFYQVSISAGQICQIIFYSFYVVTLKWWSGVERDGMLWFMNRYFLMYYTAHLATPFFNVSITTSLLLSLSMSIDRFWALYLPHAYKNWNHKRNRIIAFTISIILGLATSIFAFDRYQILSNFNSTNNSESLYELELDVVYAGDCFTVALSHIRNIIRMAGLFLLIGCNIGNLKLFRNRVMKVGVSGNKDGSNRAKTKFEAERTLFLLVIVESTLTTIEMTSITAYFVAIFTIPSFPTCSGLLMIPLVDGLISLCSLGKFAIVFAIDHRFRRMIINAICCKKEGITTGNTVAPTEMQNNTTRAGATRNQTTIRHS